MSSDREKAYFQHRLKDRERMTDADHAREAAAVPYDGPTSGRALYRWAAMRQQVSAIMAAGTELGFAGRMVDWHSDQVRRVYELAQDRRLAAAAERERQQDAARAAAAAAAPAADQ
jgi:hypothetical protein